jgi:site-specific recombinase XerD
MTDLTTTGAVEPTLRYLAALERRPSDDERWNIVTVTAAWLASRKSEHTHKAYEREIRAFLGWCAETGRDPRDCHRGDIDAFAVVSGAHLAPASLARRLSTVSSWYRYAASNDVVTRNPVDAIDRPVLSPDASETMGLTSAQLRLFMQTARNARNRTAARDTAVLAVIAQLDLRCGEALGLDVDSLSYDRGHRVVTVRGKGNKMRRLPVPPPLIRDLDRYLEIRHGVTESGGGAELSGPLFVTATGRRLDQPSVFRLVRRIAKGAGIPGWERLSVHSLRHSVATAALEEKPLHLVQDLLGHADPRTTRRYDRQRNSLDLSAAYAISKLFAEDDG